MAIVLLVVGTIAEELFKSDFETSRRCSFIEERATAHNPFVFHKTANNAESPMFWNSRERKETINALENMLIRDIYIVKYPDASMHRVLTTQKCAEHSGRTPILPLLPEIHAQKCHTEKQIQKKFRGSHWTNEEMEDAEQPVKIRRTSLHQSEVTSFEYS